MRKYFKKIIVTLIIIVTTSMLVACNIKPVDILVAKEILEIGYAKDESADLVKSDVVLPTTIEGFKGLSVSWVSDEPEIISIAGHVNRPTTETVVTLTATLKVLELSENKIFLLTVLAKDELPPIEDDEKVALEKIREDINALDSIDIVNFMVNAPTSGAINNSLISWSYNSLNITRRGIVVPYNFASKSREATATAKFSLGQYSLEKKYSLTLPDNENTVINLVKNVPFKNMTTEYNVQDTNFNIYQNQNGAVAYVSVKEFIELLRGLISPSLVFKYEDSDGVFKVSYDYYDEENNESHTLTMTLDTINNKITTNDSGFFYGYVEGTETNFSRNISYDSDSPLNHYVASDGYNLDLGKYGFSVIDHEGDALIPLSVANQLFATSNYYSVHYNQDQLTGVFFIPNPDSLEGLEILHSSINGSNIPNDLLVHNFNFLAFFFDNFYGLKEYQNIETYYDILFSRKNNLLSNSAAMVDNEIFILLNSDIDENHTYFGLKSTYQTQEASGPQLTSLSQMGPNNYNYYVNGLWAMDDVIGEKWGPAPKGFESWNAYLPNRLPYWFVDNQSVVITLDGFETANIEESYLWNYEIILETFDINNFNYPLPALEDGGYYYYFNNSDLDLSLLEILITDITSDRVDSYKHLLTELSGFTYHSAAENNNYEFYKSDGYYTKQVDGVDYMIQVVYNEEFKVAYLGIANETPTNFNDEWPFYHDVNLLVESDSAIYLEFYLANAFRDKPFLEHAILDITWNMGGNIGALYRVLGIMFGSSFSVSSFNPTLGEKSTNVIFVNSYHYDLNWYILTSPVSFSAGNLLPTIVRQNNLAPILGQKSGGGAASVTPVYLPIGTIFAASSSNVSAIVSGENTTSSPYVYEINEGGIIPDYIIPLAQIFDPEILKEIIYG